MRTLFAAAALALMYGSALAQNTGPAPQSGMEKPAMTNGARRNGAMDTSGMSGAKGNVTRETDDAPAAGKDGDKKDDVRK